MYSNELDEVLGEDATEVWSLVCVRVYVRVLSVSLLTQRGTAGEMNFTDLSHIFFAEFLQQRKLMAASLNTK